MKGRRRDRGARARAPHSEQGEWRLRNRVCDLALEAAQRWHSFLFEKVRRGGGEEWGRFDADRKSQGGSGKGSKPIAEAMGSCRRVLLQGR